MTSGALGGVTEALVAHEISQHTTVVSQPVDPSTYNPLGLGTPPPVLAPVTTASLFGVTHPASSAPSPSVLSPSVLRTLTGSTLLSQLGVLPQHDLAAFVKFWSVASSSAAATSRCWCAAKPVRLTRRCAPVRMPASVSATDWWRRISSPACTAKSKASCPRRRVFEAKNLNRTNKGYSSWQT